MKNKIEVVKVLIQNKEGKFLVVQKSDDYDWKAGKWELPGGKIESEEDEFEAARREIKSETGLDIENLSDVVRTEIEEPNLEKPVLDCWISLTENFSGEIRLSEEHQNFEWVSAGEFLRMDWHRDAGFGIPAMSHLGKYFDENKKFNEDYSKPST